MNKSEVGNHTFMEVNIAVSRRAVSKNSIYSTTKTFTLFSEPSTSMLAAMLLVQSPGLLKVIIRLNQQHSPAELTIWWNLCNLRNIIGTLLLPDIVGCEKVVCAPLGVGGELTGRMAMTACVLDRLYRMGKDTLGNRGCWLYYACPQTIRAAYCVVSAQLARGRGRQASDYVSCTIIILRPLRRGMTSASKHSPTPLFSTNHQHLSPADKKN